MLRIEDEDEGKRTCIPQPRNALITVFDFRVVSVMKSIRDPTLLAVVKYAMLYFWPSPSLSISKSASAGRSLLLGVHEA